MNTKAAKTLSVTLHVLAFLAAMLAVQQLTFVLFSEQYVERNPGSGRLVIVSRTASWPWSAGSAGVLLLVVVLLKSSILEANFWRMNRRQWAGVALCAWAVLYLFMLVRYDQRTGRHKPDMLMWVEEWETNAILRQAAYDPTFSLGLLLGIGQFAAGMALATVGARPWHVPGYCRGCGYCLAGNTSGVCPECGRPIHNVPTESDKESNGGT